MDNLSNSSVKVFDRLQRLCGPLFSFVKADLRDADTMDAVFAAHQIGGVDPFAGLKAVGESVAQPLRYLDNNVGITLIMLQCMERTGVRPVRWIVFS